MTKLLNLNRTFISSKKGLKKNYKCDESQKSLWGLENEKVNTWTERLQIIENITL